MKDKYLFIFFLIFGVISIPLKNYMFNERVSRELLNNTTVSLYTNTPECVRVFSAIEKYSSDYKIPIRYALGIAYYETRYEGPMQWNYTTDGKISSAGALGTMQVMPSTAKLMWGFEVPNIKLIKDIEFNVETSMKLLLHLFDIYKDWKIVFGCYNTGQPLVNDYSEKVYNFKTNYE